MRIGLVLGSGGIVGASYLIGALEAVRRLTGWEPAMAHRIVGTSAGAYVGSLACAVPIWLMDAHCTGELPQDVTVDPAAWALASRLDRHNTGAFWRRYPPSLHGIRPFFSSVAAIREALRQGVPLSWELLATGLIGHGVFSNQSVGAVVREACQGRWPHPHLWITACELEGGTRVVFRPDQEMPVPIDKAVAASTAIPGLFAPVTIRGCRYVDGGAWSSSNADLLVDDDLDLVLAILPLAGREQTGLPSGWLDRFDRWTRRRMMARLEREAKPLAESGKRVVVLTPSPQDWPSSLWLDHMNIGSRPGVIRSARAVTMRRLTSDPQMAWVLASLREAAQPVWQKVA